MCHSVNEISNVKVSMKRSKRERAKKKKWRWFQIQTERPLFNASVELLLLYTLCEETALRDLVVIFALLLLLLIARHFPISNAEIYAKSSLFVREQVQFVWLFFFLTGISAVKWCYECLKFLRIETAYTTHTHAFTIGTSIKILS